MERYIVEVLEYLKNQQDYALVGDNAFSLYLGDELKIEFKVLSKSNTNEQFVKSLESPLEMLSKESIIINAQEKKVGNYKIKVAKPEHLIAIDIPYGDKYGSDSFDLIRKLKKEIDFEEIRCLWKQLDNYDSLYSTLTQAVYELAND
jgi:hypothetical protein